jgi:hypothetical protein
MPLGRLLADAELLLPEQVDEARERQKVAGGSLGDSCVALGFLAPEELTRFISQSPRAPRTPAETGLDDQFLLNFVLKALYVVGLETALDVAEYITLPLHVVDPLLQVCKERRLVEVTGMTGSAIPSYRFALTGQGRQFAVEALQQSSYTGPTPVPLEDYQLQVSRQAISNERIDAAAINRALSHLVLPEDTAQRLGPALNAGKAILLYGASGNGKTSIAEALAETFEQTIFVPHCIEVDGQIIKVFDPSVHHEAEDPRPAGSNGSAGENGAAEQDPRWVRCRRPTVMTAGELTMEMLDLSFDPVSKYYEAPSHMKATGGVFVIDDFGRRLPDPAHRQEAQRSLRSAGDVLDQLRALRDHGRGRPAPHPVQALPGAAERGAVRGHLPQARRGPGARGSRRRARLPARGVLSAERHGARGLAPQVDRRARAGALRLRGGRALHHARAGAGRPAPAVPERRAGGRLSFSAAC